MRIFTFRKIEFRIHAAINISSANTQREIEKQKSLNFSF